MAAVTLVTGATGMVGHSIVHELLRRGRRVRVLVRSPQRAAGVLPAGCEFAEGDITDADAVLAAAEGCETIYHAAGLPEQWLRDPSVFDTVNAGGTLNAIAAARAVGVRRFMYTSTIDVFEMSPGREFDESRLATEPKHTHYERSKQDADRLVQRAIDEGLPATFLHPSGVYGPGPTSSPGLTRAMAMIARGEVPLLLPGAVPVVYVDDIGLGHVLAEEHGAVGERFILSESSHDLADFARAVGSAAGRPKVPPTLPLWCARVFAAVSEVISSVTTRPPIVARGQVEFLQQHARPNARRARERLGWRPVPFEQGLDRTLKWLRELGELPTKSRSTQSVGERVG